MNERNRDNTAYGNTRTNKRPKKSSTILGRVVFIHLVIVLVRRQYCIGTESQIRQMYPHRCTKSNIAYSSNVKGYKQLKPYSVDTFYLQLKPYFSWHFLSTVETVFQLTLSAYSWNRISVDTFYLQLKPYSLIISASTRRYDDFFALMNN